MSRLTVVWVCIPLMLWSCGRSPTGSASPEGTVAWAGHSFREVTTVTALPPSLRTALGVDKSGLDGIADVTGRYNKTDVVDSKLPMLRFVVAGIDSNAELIAVEHGGLGWRVYVTLFSNITKKPVPDQTWTLFESTRSLRNLVERLPRR